MERQDRHVQHIWICNQLHENWQKISENKQAGQLKENKEYPHLNQPYKSSIIPQPQPIILRSISIICAYI